MVTALLLSGGTGSRMGSDIPKQYMSVNGKPLILYALEALLNHPRMDALQIVAEEKWREHILTYIKIHEFGKKFHGFSDPGACRQLSIYNGLCDIREFASDDDVVFIHDAARPNLTDLMISSYIDGMRDYDGLMPVIPMKDTVYRSIGGDKVDELLNREQIVAGQAPELFLLGKYYEANKALLPKRILEIRGSTEPAIMSGMSIAVVPGEESNYKITTSADFERFKQMIADKSQ